MSIARTTGDGRIDPEQTLRQLLDDAIERCRPQNCLPAHIPSPPSGRTIVVGAGKAAASMAQVIEARFYGHLSGAVVTRYGSALPCRTIEVLEAAHPLADPASETAACRMLELVRGLGTDDLVIALISGGGSALMALPRPPLTLGDKQQLIDRLMRAGAPIDELNQVRMALSLVKGGGLSRAIGAARCVSLIISDVVGDDPALVASGPTVPQQPKPALARAILERHGITIDGALAESLADAICSPHDACTGQRETVIVGSPDLALDAAVAFARGSGLNIVMLDPAMEGSPAIAADRHMEALRMATPGTLILSGGELTSRVTGSGRGGPNSEFCMEMLDRLSRDPKLAQATWGIAADTDGIDGNSGVAGAMIRPDTSRTIDAADIAAARAASDSGGLFERLGAQIVTGPTQTNVNDVRALLYMP